MKRLIAAVCHAVLRWAERPPVPAVRAAVALACADCGVVFAPETDLYRAGKLHEVLYHTARRLDDDEVFRTVQDVIALFEARQ